MSDDLPLYAKAALAKWGEATIQTTHGEKPTAVVMLAVFGAESGGTWDRRTRGDSIAELAAWPESQAMVRECNCVGYGSWGAPQIFMPVHAAWLKEQTGVDSPCFWAAWLCEVPHAVEAAAVILASQGPGAWSTYTGGEWLAHLAQAQAAYAAAKEAA
ncbi:MAG: hypothetical protein KGK07_07220 [Chloroflexota bacterium]|nr:hypothetical protein [Chloroflexota bacterium]